MNFVSVHKVSPLQTFRCWPRSGEWWQGWPPSYIQRLAGGPLVVMRRLGTEEASRHYPASNPRLEADPMLLELAEWWLRVGCGQPNPVKWNISRRRGGQEDKKVGSEVASLQQPASGPPCSPPLCHPVDKGRLAAMGWMSSSGLPVGRWCYARTVSNYMTESCVYR